MTAEQLLKPRFEVVENYPNSKYEIGLVLTNTVTDYFTYEKHEKGFVTNIKNIEDYPHLFKKLNWWEKRTKEQMPKYLVSLAEKDNDDFDINKQEVYKILDWDMRSLDGIIDYEKRQVCSLTSWNPEYGYLPISVSVGEEKIKEKASTP